MTIKNYTMQFHYCSKRNLLTIITQSFSKDSIYLHYTFLINIRLTLSFFPGMLFINEILNNENCTIYRQKVRST